VRLDRQIAGGVGLLIGGGLIGLAAVALHALWWGLALATAASLAVLWALPPRMWTLPAYAIGWWIPLVVAWQGRREGDYAVESSPYGYGLIVLGTVVLVAAAFRTALGAPIRGSGPGSASRGAR